MTRDEDGRPSIHRRPRASESCPGCGYAPAPRRAEHDRLCDACLVLAVRDHADADTIIAELLGSGAWRAS